MIPGKPLDHVPKAGASVAYTTTRAPGEPFIQLAIRAGRDTRLKLVAKGLLWELLTYHDSELPSDEDLCREHRARREAEGLKPDGIDLIRGGLDDLERWGYLVRLQIRDSKGQCRSVRALTDSPGYHKLNVLAIYHQAHQVAGKAERLAAERELLEQQEFPRGAHCPPVGSRDLACESTVIDFEARRIARASRQAV